MPVLAAVDLVDATGAASAELQTQQGLRKLCEGGESGWEYGLRDEWETRAGCPA
jgi:hypothetical protein